MLMKERQRKPILQARCLQRCAALKLQNFLSFKLQFYTETLKQPKQSYAFTLWNFLCLELKQLKQLNTSTLSLFRTFTDLHFRSLTFSHFQNFHMFILSNLLSLFFFTILLIHICTLKPVHTSTLYSFTFYAL